MQEDAHTGSQPRARPMTELVSPSDICPKAAFPHPRPSFTHDYLEQYHLAEVNLCSWSNLGASESPPKHVLSAWTPAWSTAGR